MWTDTVPLNPFQISPDMGNMVFASGETVLTGPVNAAAIRPRNLLKLGIQRQLLHPKTWLFRFGRTFLQVQILRLLRDLCTNEGKAVDDPRTT